MELKNSKCQLAMPSVTFLEHHITSDGIRQDSARLGALMQLPTPSNVKELRRAPGMFGYYREFVPRYAEATEPLVKLTRKSVDWSWESEQKQAVRQVLEHLSRDLVLSHFNHRDPLIDTDASRSGIAGMLFTEVGGRVVACDVREPRP